MPEFDCEATRKHVHEYLHKELSESEIADVTTHLANCDSCDGDYAVENVLNKLIDSACQDQPPQDLAERVLNRVRDIQQGIAH